MAPPRVKPTRRQVLAGAAAASAGALAGCFPEVGGRWPTVDGACVDEGEAAPLDGGSPVVEVYREASVKVDPATSRADVQEAEVQAMLDAALAALVEGGQLWKTVLPDFTPGARIGIKVNTLNDQCPTQVAVVKALISALQKGLGADPAGIIVWDRRLDELTRCGFTESALGVRVMGTQNSTTDLGGPGYGDPVCGRVAGKSPRLSRILTDLTDFTVNCPVLKTHGVSGVTGALKNIYGIIHNPGDYHASLLTALPALYRLPPIRNRIRLTVIDALIAVTTGGTSSPPDTVPRRILVSLDPLAADSHALVLVNKLRAEKNLNLPEVDPTVTTWLQNGFELGLGTLRYQLRAL
ncbi:MAG: DUF362 domain-containing protein [Myxococcaceae bacterium]